MTIRGAIFDIDGTLLDSMGIWDTIATDYLRSCGVTPRPDVDDAVRILSMEDAARYFIRVRSCAHSAGDRPGGRRPGHGLYRLHVQLKPGAAALLAALTRRGVKLCAATSGDGRSPVPRSSAAAFCRASAGCLPVPRSAAARTRRRFTRRRGHIWARPRVKPPCSRTRFTPCKPRNGPGFTPSPSQTRPPVGTGRRCAHPQTSTLILCSTGREYHGQNRSDDRGLGPPAAARASRRTSRSLPCTGSTR